MSGRSRSGPPGTEAIAAFAGGTRQLLRLDHATKSALQYVYPDADIPIVQMSIDETQPASFHFDYSNRKLSFKCE